ncbi:MAG TPA: DUF4203 domain-containing protein [Candidatus Limnocylindria bacterium]|nr:DUF4203 domain-containing protein [Candidatus Limnocylindria bacterium]
MDVFVALITAAIGLIALFFGYRIFKLLLPLFGFFVGLVVGAEVVATIFGEGFLASVIGIVAGLVVGLLFGALAYVWWWLGVILVFAGMGYALGVSILPAFGLELDLVSVLIGLVVAAVFALGAIVLRMPKLVVIGVTALWGSGATIAAWLVFVDELQPDELGYGAVNAVVAHSTLWLIVFFALAVVGMAFQLASTREYELMWDEEWPGQRPAAPSAPTTPSSY